MDDPDGVAVDAQGRILVAASSIHRVDRFAVAGDGTVSFDRAFGINVDPTDGNTGDFENCTSTCQTGTASGAAGGMNDPGGVAFDAQGRILVADNGSHRVHRFTVTLPPPPAPAVDADTHDPRNTPQRRALKKCKKKKRSARSAEEGEEASAAEPSAGGGTRTPDTRIMIPLL